MTEANGRETLSLAGMSDDDVHFMHWFAARFRDYSPDARRTVTEWCTKFDLGVIEHGALRLDRMSPVRELRMELGDATAYLAMIRLQVGDIEAAMARVDHPRPRLDDPAFVARLRAHAADSYPEDLNPNDLRG